MKDATAFLLCTVLGGVAYFLALVSIGLSIFNPDARIYKDLAHIQLFYALYASGALYCGYYKNVHPTAYLAFLGVLVILYGIVGIQTVATEATTCRDIPDAHISSNAICSVVTEQNGRVVPGTCTFIDSTLSKCVVGAVTKDSQIAAARAAGQVSVGFAVTQFVLCVFSWLLVVGHFWSKAIEAALLKTRQELKYAEEAIASHIDGSRFTPLKNMYNDAVNKVETWLPSKKD